MTIAKQENCTADDNGGCSPEKNDFETIKK
jgi:hypothetical protein